jgi:PAS domain S-box-containing protein
MKEAVKVDMREENVKLEKIQKDLDTSLQKISLMTFERNWLEKIPLISLVIDSDFRIVDANKLASEILEYTRRELIGKNLLDIVSTECEKLPKLFSRRRVSKFSLSTECTTKSGKIVQLTWLAENSRPISDGYCVCVATSFTKP